MRVLLYLYYPFFDTHLAGGVQVWLRHLVSEIMRRDSSIHITVLCPNSNLHSYPNDIDVQHVLLDMEQDFLSPLEVYENLQVIRKAEIEADLVWIIDRTFPISSIKPQLLSLNTICYEREVMSIFQSDLKAIACPSQFVKDQLEAVVDDERKIVKIPYYIDPIFLKEYPDRYERVNKYFDYRPENKYILFPHRPDRSKGHEEAISILEKLLVHDSRYYLLIPKAPDAKVSNVVSESQYVQELEKLSCEKGISNHVIFHDWINYDDIPSYYSIGYCTLFFSRLPETFGLTLLNSAVCGTPVISLGSGALKEVVSPGGVHIVVSDTSVVHKLILNGFDQERIERDVAVLKSKYLIDSIAETYIRLLHDLTKVKLYD